MLCPYPLYYLSVVYIAPEQEGLLAKAGLFVWTAANEPQKNGSSTFSVGRERYN